MKRKYLPDRRAINEKEIFKIVATDVHEPIVHISESSGSFKLLKDGNWEAGGLLFMCIMGVEM